LLASALDEPVDERVCERIIADARGNPLALLELPRGLSAAELAVGVTPPSGTPLAKRIEASFAGRIASLPEDTRRLLLLVALDPLGGPQRVASAARGLGLSPQAGQPAVDAGLLEVGPDVRFRHPLIGSAVQHSATLEECRRAHAALADASDPNRDPDRRAWHLAQSASGPDESIAVELERSAGRARERGGLAAAAAFLELSAELTVDRSRAAHRRLLAAGAQQMAGAGERAQELLAASLPDLDGVPERAAAMRLEGALRFADGHGGDTPSLLLEAAMALRASEPTAARETLMEAMEAAMWAGALTTGTTTLDVARAASTIRAPAQDANPASVLLSGYTKRFLEGYPAAVGTWREAIAAFEAEVERSPQTQWHGMMYNATGETLDFAGHVAVARRWLRLAREQGALATLPVALSGLGWCEMLAGRVQTAESLLSESLDISAATGAPAVPGANEILRMAILDWRGLESAPAVGESVTTEAVARGQGLGVTIVRYGRTIYELGHGRYEDARGYALSLFDEDPLYFGTINLADVIEATFRSGDFDGARAALDRLELRAGATATPWGLGLLARGRALLADDDEAERHYADSLDHLGRSGVTTEQARTHLLFGEWLRRRRRRRDARTHLRMAHELFEAMGTEAFARRASVELLATGETARRRVPHTRDLLTPQERQIAQLAAEGHTNAAIGAQLFISPHTVAYHLRKVFSKLGVTARNQLGHAPGESIGPAEVPEFAASQGRAV
jgi:DNA-binding CsgD family transcriptional regulator